MASEDPNKSVEPGFFKCSSNPPAPGATVFLRNPSKQQTLHVCVLVCVCVCAC